MNFPEMKKAIETEKDFIALKKFGFSLENLIKRFPDGCPNKLIAQALLMSEPEVEETYQKAVIKLRLIMGVDGAL